MDAGLFIYFPRDPGQNIYFKVFDGQDIYCKKTATIMDNINNKKMKIYVLAPG